MDMACAQLLAGVGLADHQRGGVAAGDAFDLLEQEDRGSWNSSALARIDSAMPALSGKVSNPS
ncbi:MAG TPA: hypothetical protein VFG03_07785 [Telluria sp.]|nr:hypothetical protein [Telluria sp.]